jgi:hypothetical protein
MLAKFKATFSQASRHRINLENYLKEIDVTGNILDIGGAQRPIINRISSKSKILDYKILDLPVPHSSNSDNIDYKLDIQSYSFDPREIKVKFDVIFCLEVSLYWHDPIQALRNIVGLMTPGTKLYINFHQLYANQRPISMDMLRYSYNWIDKMCKIYNLRIISTKTSQFLILSSLALKFVYRIERMRLNKEYIHFKSNSFFLVLEIAND